MVLRAEVQAKPAHACRRVDGLSSAQQEAQREQLRDGPAPGGKTGEYAPNRKADGKWALDAKPVDHPAGRDLEGRVGPEESRVQQTTPAIGKPEEALEVAIG